MNHAVLITLIALFTLESLVYIVLVGRPRKAITSVDAAIITVVNAVSIVALLVWGAS